MTDNEVTKLQKAMVGKVVKDVRWGGDIDDFVIELEDGTLIAAGTSGGYGTLYVVKDRNKR